MPDVFNANNILLGSGDLYLLTYVDTIPDDATLEVEANMVGRIKGGAELSYKPTEYEVTDDKNEVIKRFITKEEVTFKTGILTWFQATLAKLCPGVLTDDSVKKESVLTIGGARTLTAQAIRFVHTKDNGFKLRVTLVGTAGEGFTLKFDPAKETVIDAVFKALSQTNGVLVTIRDQYAAVA